ncbi:MAG: hypothetical protein WKF84_27300 [Pyrinomonadaceae bacterium]
MVKVESYLKVGDTFVLISEFEGRVPDPMYVEGAIELEMNGVKVLSLELWDDINYLWPYVAGGLLEITKEQEWSTDFPDQPITLTFRTDARRQRIFVEVDPSRGVVKTSASYDEFMTAMSEAAQEFFRRMAELIPEERTDWERELRTLQAGIPMLQRG